MKNKTACFNFMAAAVLVLQIAPAAAQQSDADQPSAQSNVESVHVTATRSGKQVQDEPIHVEVVGRDEVEEETAMSPGGVARLLSETSGVHFQVNSASLGAANLSIQGLRGHYTQLLSDGLPLYGGQTDSLDLLQIPPADLERVEIIKGVASALYGPSALGGVINLVSRRPEPKLTKEAIVNATSVDGQDAVGYLSGPVAANWAFTLLSGLHRQSRNDLNNDGWADTPAYQRAILRPRLFWDDDAGSSVLVTGGFTAEGRSGGTMAGGTVANGSPYQQKLNTRRWDLGSVAAFQLGQDQTLNLRGSIMGADQSHLWGAVTDQDHHGTFFGEASLTENDASHTWTLGTAIQQDIYHSRNFGSLDYSYTVPALFAQDEYSPTDWVTLAASARADFHTRYGTFISPRLSALLRLPDWTVRGSIGEGHYAPTPFTEETTDVPSARIQPLRNVGLETVHAASVDAERSFGPIVLNASLFASAIYHPQRLAPVTAPGQVAFVSAQGPTRTAGGELLATYNAGNLAVTGGYVFTYSSEVDPQTGIRGEADLVPRHTGTLTGMWEDKWGKLGLEAFYTGRQALDDPTNENPYRKVGSPYVLFGALAEWNLTERLSLFINAENLTDVRQTRYDPLLRPQQALDGRWTVDVWAPLDGRLINGGLKAQF
jgi:outer membrane receptor for ferrienterochelin and colicins